MLDPLEVLMPNHLGSMFENRGVEELFRNRGLGVKEAIASSPLAMAQQSQISSSSVSLDKIRTAKAREFGKTKETVGF